MVLKYVATDATDRMASAYLCTCPPFPLECCLSCVDLMPICRICRVCRVFFQKKNSKKIYKYIPIIYGDGFEICRDRRDR